LLCLLAPFGLCFELCVVVRSWFLAGKKRGARKGYAGKPAVTN
jgi:hypothetical protein